MSIIIDKKLSLRNNAGFKARVDVINIVKELGFNYIGIEMSDSKLKSLYSLMKLVFSLKVRKNEYVIIQYPMNRAIINLLLFKLNFYKCKTICFIHDINTLRDNAKESKIKKEINIFNKFDTIISHNEEMTRWLRSNGVFKEIENLEIFDFLGENTKEVDIKNNLPYRITYATGLLGDEKSHYLYQVGNIFNKHTSLLLYGGIEDRLKNNLENNHSIKYKGSINPNEITQLIEGDFGLLWDSSSITCCKGIWGEYTRFNNPHKLSMYLVAKLPVICWEESAVAQFVKKHNIGICINNLNEIEDILSNLTNEQYYTMKKNVIKISNQLNKGYYTKKVINRIIEE